VEGTRNLSSLAVDDGQLYWLESRPEEGGRTTIMRWRAGGQPEEILPAPWNARTRVQEYGGGALLVAAGTIWFSNYADQRLYRLVPGQSPKPVTPKAELRYAGCALDRLRSRLLCIREDHRAPGEPRNTLVALPLDKESAGEILFDDSDFVSAPQLSPDGSKIAFTSWDHPNMPWDDTTLWSAGFNANGTLAGLTRHNSDGGEAVINPQWSPQGQLYAISDRDNWWKIYRVTKRQFSAVDGAIDQTETGGPAWGIGQDYYHFLKDGRIAAMVMQGGPRYAAILDPEKGKVTPLALASAEVLDILPVADQLFIINAYTDRPEALVATDLQGNTLNSIRTATDARLDPKLVPQYQLVSFTTSGGATAHGIYLPPTNPETSAPAGDRPPLLVTVHGGPTAATSPAFDREQLYWTSRGFAILDLNYRGSTGFGRDYRQALYGEWGVADVDDAVAGALWLADQGLADPDRLLIRGGSAGGYTTLAALSFHDTFAAGTSYYGVSDIEALAQDTHKFESRYLDQLIGPYPERRDLYRQRSPIHHLDGFSAPLLLLQGLDDPVVPPNQSEMIFAALKSRGLPTAYLAFEGEAHGFRKAENRIRSLEAELYFYGRVLDIPIADKLPEIPIENLQEPPHP
jgi:dipeptidyl aminopeptidase/acylaminoacyl peptidase